MKLLLAGFIVLLSYSYCLAADCEQTVKDTAKKFVQAQYDGLLMVWEKSERLVIGT